MRIYFVVLSSICLLGSPANAAQTTSDIYLLTKNDGRWCSYTNRDSFQRDSDKISPLESARVKYLSRKIENITYQVQSESGDWLVIDSYTYNDFETRILRSIIFAQNGTQVFQKASIYKGKISKFYTSQIINPKGIAIDPKTIDYPQVSIAVNNLSFPFSKLLVMRKSLSPPIICLK